MTRQIITPGEVIVKGDKFLPGEGTEKRGEEIIALKYGLAAGVALGVTYFIIPLTVASILTTAVTWVAAKVLFSAIQKRAILNFLQENTEQGDSITDLSEITNLVFKASTKAIPADLGHYLPNLESLDVSGTEITSLDLSKNTALKRLDVSNTGITSLDVSNTGITSRDQIIGLKKGTIVYGLTS